VVVVGVDIVFGKGEEEKRRSDDGEEDGMEDGEEEESVCLLTDATCCNVCFVE